MSPVESTARHLTAGHVLAAPPIAATALSICGIALSDWVYIIAIASGCVSIAYTIWKWVRDARADRQQAPRPTVPLDR
jgi:hypothetical protein